MSVTELQVIDAAIEQFEKRGGFTTSHYQQNKKGYESDYPGEHVVSCCAVGGVEQAIWQLTGKDPTREHGRMVQPPSYRRSIYARVIRKLNRKAVALYPVLDGSHMMDVEDITFHGSKTVAKKRVLRVFRAVREDLASGV